MTKSYRSYDDFDRLLFDRPAPHVLRITLNRPERRNAIDAALHDQLNAIWALVDADLETRVAIVTGAGQSFCAGGDFGAMPTEPEPLDSNAKFAGTFGDARALVAGLVNMRKPLISAINGPAVGAGLAIALLADIPIAARTAKLFDGHLRIGVVPGDHAAIIWPLLCGLAKAKYHLLADEPVTGEQAERMNLVALAVDDDALQDKAVAVAVKLANTAPTALQMTKYILNHYLRQNQTVFDLSLAMEIANFGSAEQVEAMRALAAKEVPDFGDTVSFR